MPSLARLSVVAVVFVLVIPAASLRSQQTAESDSIYVVAKYDEARDPAADLQSAVARARTERKRILMVVGGDWCIDCLRMDLFMRQTSAVAAALRAGFLVLKVNFSHGNRNEAFLAAYPEIEWYPHVFVLESDGSLLHSQDTRALHGQRTSYSEERFLEFLRQWTP